MNLETIKKDRIDSGGFVGYEEELISQLEEKDREMERLQNSLDRVTGMRFSDRSHAALVCRAEEAEAGEAKTIKVLEACEQVALDLQARVKEFEKGLKAIQKADCICCYGADLAKSLLIGKE